MKSDKGVLIATFESRYTNTTINKVYNKIYDVINAAGGISIINASLSNNGYTPWVRSRVHII
ncbi:protein of unknown function [Shewanella benthica]|uniref:Uncharacterized protein n=1 Tax=Shewanella benthica TaxID=43661 RepID=A0A330M5D4_9GAMM|nr:protein of unknown function [Shewanella benthica]